MCSSAPQVFVSSDRNFLCHDAPILVRPCHFLDFHIAHTTKNTTQHSSCNGLECRHAPQHSYFHHSSSIITFGIIGLANLVTWTGFDHGHDHHDHHDHLHHDQVRTTRQRPESGTVGFPVLKGKHLLFRKRWKRFCLFLLFLHCASFQMSLQIHFVCFQVCQGI